MIINLNLTGKLVLIVGGGSQAQKRVNLLLKQDCTILVISPSITAPLKRLIALKKIKLVRQKVVDVSFISKYKPDMIITTTNDTMINHKIIVAARKRGIIVYSSDNSEDSDFTNPALIDFGGVIKIAIFTDGKSPTMAKQLKSKTELALKKIITDRDIAQAKIQGVARELAKKESLPLPQRKAYLARVMNDGVIDQLIKDGKIKKAEKQAMTLLRSWR